MKDLTERRLLCCFIITAPNVSRISAIPREHQTLSMRITAECVQGLFNISMDNDSDLNLFCLPMKYIQIHENVREFMLFF